MSAFLETGCEKWLFLKMFATEPDVRNRECDQCQGPEKAGYSDQEDGQFNVQDDPRGAAGGEEGSDFVAEILDDGLRVNDEFTSFRVRFWCFWKRLRIYSL